MFHKLGLEPCLIRKEKCTPMVHRERKSVKLIVNYTQKKDIVFALKK